MGAGPPGPSHCTGRRFAECRGGLADQARRCGGARSSDGDDGRSCDRLSVEHPDPDSPRVWRTPRSRSGLPHCRGRRRGSPGPGDRLPCVTGGSLRAGAPGDRLVGSGGAEASCPPALGLARRRGASGHALRPAISRCSPGGHGGPGSLGRHGAAGDHAPHLPARRGRGRVRVPAPVRAPAWIRTPVVRHRGPGASTGSRRGGPVSRERRAGGALHRDPALDSIPPIRAVRPHRASGRCRSLNGLHDDRSAGRGGAHGVLRSAPVSPAGCHHAGLPGARAGGVVRPGPHRPCHLRAKLDT